MNVPIQISFHGMEPSPALERRIREKARKLERFHDRLTSCHVVVEARARRQHSGRLYRLLIELKAPGYELTVGNTGRSDPAHKDVYVAVRDAFDAAARQLEDHARISRGDVKKHDVSAYGKESWLSRAAAEGAIRASDAREINLESDPGERRMAKVRKKPKGGARTTSEQPGKKVTISDIHELAGEINDADAAAIIATGATRADFEQACYYAQGYGDVVDRSGHPLTGAAAASYEILTAHEEDERER